MLKKNEKILVFTPLRFFSLDDEDLFFRWINKVKCVKSYKGIGKELHLVINNENISYKDFANLRGIFKRYKLKNIEQLKQLFMNEYNGDWFK